MITLSGRFTLNVSIRETPNEVLYRGYREPDGAPVVVKALHPEHPSPEDLARLRHEYALLRSLELPQVVRAHALEPFGRGLALIIDDAGELSLDMLIRDGRVELKQGLEIAISIAELVASLHRHDIVHKDIKPHHLFLRDAESSHVTLVDLGIAIRLPRQVQAPLPVTQLEGSLPYIAPEQTGRMNRIVDRRSDLYSMGVTLFQLFTGRLPFETTDALELVHCHLARQPPAARDLRPEVPRELSDIITRLMAKEAEQRYQSAEGVRHDLALCLERLAALGHAVDAPTFTLGERDAASELRIPQKLYGREVELRELGAALQRVEAGASELILLSGDAGVGKSALVGEVWRRLVRGGRMVSGKFDQLARGVPYAPLARACQCLVEQLLGESSDTLAHYRQILTEVLGPNGQLIAELVPQLPLVTGPLPEAPTVGPTESQRRFEMAFEAFLGAFCTAEQPLVLFLDDWQWADAASLRLVQLVLRGRHLLVVGAYRKSKITPLHPVSCALEAIREDGTPVCELALEPLGLAQVTQLLSEALSAEEARVEPLARTLTAKTQGNPFFLNQFLMSLHHEGLLVLDPDRREWTWDLAQVSEMVVTANVVDFLLARLRNLSAPAQDALRLAACLGNHFDGGMLEAVSRHSPADLGRCLWEAMHQELVVPLDGNFRYAAEADQRDEPAHAPPARYRFLHDRVQQAAYALIEDADRAAIHLDIGRLLLARARHEVSDDELFAVVDHLDRGRKLVVDPQERILFAELSLRAGRKARDAAAPAVALHYLDAALGLLGDAAWTEHYGIAHPAHVLKAECEHLSRNPGEALRTLDVAETNAATMLDRIAVRNLKTAFLTTTGKLAEACSNSVDSLQMLGVPLPQPTDTPALRAAIGSGFGAYQEALGGRSVESLAELPLMTAEEPLATMDTLAFAVPPAYMCNPELHAALVLKGVAETLVHGTAPVSPFFYVQYAIVHMVVTGDMTAAHRFGRVGIELSAQVGAPALAGQAHFVFGGFVAHLREHLSVGIEHLRVGLRQCLELGDLAYAAFSTGIVVFCRFLAGHPLDGITSDVEAADEIARRTDGVLGLQFCELHRRVIQALKGQSRSLGSLDCGGVDEAAFAETLMPPARSWYLLYKTGLQFLAGDYAGALAASDECQPLASTPGVPELAFFRALVLAELARTREAHEREVLIERIRAEAKLLEVWANSAPCNYAPRHHLVLAELATLQGATAVAMGLYDQSIAGAREHGFAQIEAIANEASGLFHLTEGRITIGRAYLKEAAYAYQRWGAMAKVEQLAAAHPWLRSETGGWGTTLGLGTSAGTGSVSLAEPTDTAAVPRCAGGLDLATAIRATEALATELVFERVIERLMRTLLENAGAQRGFLVLEQKGALTIAAAITIEPDAVRLGLSEDLDTTEGLSRAMVHYVARTARPLVLADASRDSRYQADPYVRRSQPKSILAVPLLHRAKLIGVVYLENNTATDAFGPVRAELLQFLAAQAAAAFENARLYGELQAASESLEAQVAQQTEKLRRALAELWSEMDLARKIQTVLLPKTTRFADYDVAATMIPADSVGGDYYDIVEFENGGWVLVGDVSGHGVPAGLVMMMVQTAVRAFLESECGTATRSSPAVLLSQTNAATWSNIQLMGDNQYMTIMALKLVEGQVQYSGMHQDILVHRAASNTVERFESYGVWLGVERDISRLLRVDTFELDPGDTILLVTDGISEAFVDGHRLETELPSRFGALASQGLDPGAIVRGILGPVSGTRPLDDMTVMAIRYAPEKGTGGASS